MQRSSTRNTAWRLTARGWWLPGMLAVAAAGCEPMTRSELPLNCDAAENKIDRDVTSLGYYPFELLPAASANSGNFFCFTDEVADGYPAKGAPFPAGGCQKPMVEPINGGEGFCNGTSADTNRHKAAFAIRAGGHDFYGGEVANWDWNPGIQPAFVPDGIAFWARSDIESDKFITIYMNDYQSSAPADTVPGTTYSPSLVDKKISGHLEAGCVPTAGSVTSQTGLLVQLASTDPNVQTNSSNVSLVSSPDQCGNRWRRLLQTSEDWELHLLPFDTFYQDIQPNRAAGPIDPAVFYSIAFGFGRGMAVSLWIDEIFFYRHKPAATPTDADAGTN